MPYLQQEQRQPAAADDDEDNLDSVDADEDSDYETSVRPRTDRGLSRNFA